MTRLLALLLILPLAAPALARPVRHRLMTHGIGEKTCKTAATLTGVCRVVKGSLGLTQGIGVTLNAEDGSRIIIKAPADSNADIAPTVMQNWLFWQDKTHSMRTRIQGTFEVCPLPAEINAAAIKDFACINSGSRITQDKSVAP